MTEAMSRIRVIMDEAHTKLGKEPVKVTETIPAATKSGPSVGGNKVVLEFYF